VEAVTDRMTAMPHDVRNAIRAVADTDPGADPEACAYAVMNALGIVRLDVYGEPLDPDERDHEPEQGALTFTCGQCGRSSHHPEDVRHGYCSACHAFTGTGVQVAGTPEERARAEVSSYLRLAPNAGRVYQLDARFHAAVAQVRQLIERVDEALEPEGLDAAARERVMQRLVYGSLDADRAAARIEATAREVERIERGARPTRWRPSSSGGWQLPDG
jgi:hypothetical protein